MAGKRPSKSTTALVATALTVVQQLLTSQEVRDALVKAPRDVINWARNQREARSAKKSTGQSRYDLTERFGQKGLERRVKALAANVELAFAGPEATGRAELLEAVAGLRRALVVAAPLPLLKRKKAHSRIDKELDSLEMALVDAVLPKS